MMRDERRTIGAALLGAALVSSASAGQARAQEPLPTTIPPPVIVGPVEAPHDHPAPNLAPAPPSVPTAEPTGIPGPIMAAPIAGEAPVLHPPIVGGQPAPPVHVHQPGPIGRAFHHIGFTIKDRMVGEPERFDVPPLGWSVGKNFAAQRAMADLHRFTLYRTDFLHGTEQLNPEGLRRLGRMMATLHCYPGPLIVEVDPNRPGLAEARRLAVIELAATNGALLEPDRLIVGGSPYLGGRGDLSEIYNGVLLDRAVRAPTVYPLNPNPNADFQN